MKPFISPLAPQIERFLKFKRAVGCRYERAEERFFLIDRFFASHLPPADPVITDTIIRTYITDTGNRTERLLSLLRQFCCFVGIEEPRTFIPPRGFLGIRQTPFVPRVLTREEGRAFLKACSFLPPCRWSPLRGMVHGTALMLLYLAGMRVGEAISLNIEDVDLANGVLRIRKSKFGKSRFVPMAQDLTDRMGQCRCFVDRFLGVRPPDASFFSGPKGLCCTDSALRYSFRKVLAEAKIPYLGVGKGPRLHDLRHSYAVHRMMLWYEQGADLGVKLPILAIYLGHIGMSSSQYYLRLTEDLLSSVLSRYEVRFGKLIEERRTENDSFNSDHGFLHEPSCEGA